LPNPENGDKKSLRCPAIVAKASIVDPECMMTMPKKVLASVGFDALCHCVEAYTANNSQPFTDALALYAMPLIIDNLPSLVNGSDSMEAWEKMPSLPRSAAWSSIRQASRLRMAWSIRSAA